jgi:homogentisate 1,2-dioxygenase
LRDGRPARGYICELFEGHFQLLVLGAIGSTGLANVRDFQVPVAQFDGELDQEEAHIAKTADEA